MIKLAICGVGGRIGETIFKTLIGSNEFEISFGVDAFCNREYPFPVYPSFDQAKEYCDIIVDFSSPKALESILAYACSHKTRVIIATTGHTAAQLEAMQTAGARIAVFHASNMSLGVNLLANLTKDAAKFLDEGYDVEIVEQHHNRKLDAPSGTALTLADAVNEARGGDLNYVFGRHDAAQRRDVHELGIHAIRGGSIVGKHDVMFIGDGEVITLSHESASKEVFVRGALRAAKFLMNKRAGLYDMNSIIGESYAVTTVSCERDVTLVNVERINPNDLIHILKQLASFDINLDMISQTATGSDSVSVSFTVCDEDAQTTSEVLANNKLAFSELPHQTKLTTEGAGMAHRSGVAMEVLSVFYKAGATIHAITTSETKISCCINPEAADKTVEGLKKFFGV